MTNTTFTSHNMETAFTREELDSMKEMILNGTWKDSDVVPAMDARLTYLMEHNAKKESTKEDDYLIEIVAKYMKDLPEYDRLFWMSIEIAYRQIKSHVNTTLSRMQVEYQDHEDYQQIVYLQLAEHLKEFDSTKGVRIPAFITTHIKGAFFDQKNRSTGVTTNTKYNATITKHAVNARNALIAAGIKNPSCADICNHINNDEKLNLKNDYTVRQIENALSHLVVQTEIDDNIHDDTYSPEAAFFRKEDAKILKNLTFQGDKNMKTLYNIYADYYLNGNDDVEYYKNNPDKIRVEKGKLSIAYLTREYVRRTGKDVSQHKVKKLNDQLQIFLRNRKLAPRKTESESIPVDLLMYAEN